MGVQTKERSFTDQTCSFMFRHKQMVLFKKKKWSLTDKRMDGRMDGWTTNIPSRGVQEKLSDWCSFSPTLTDTIATDTTAWQGSDITTGKRGVREEEEEEEGVR